MTQEEIEGNKLIAEFKCTKSFDTYYDSEGKYHFEILDSQYHSSWDWIMPACYKWDNLFFDVALEYKLAQEYELRCDALDNAITKYEILPAFKQLVENIKWFNQNKPA